MVFCLLVLPMVLFFGIGGLANILLQALAEKWL
jgi:hypothetical protein